LAVAALDMFSLVGRVAVVTGGSKGIGLAIASTLAVAGADVVIAARGKAGLDAAAQRIAEQSRGTAVTVAVDVSTRDGVEAVADAALASFDGTDILVNGIGGSRGPGFKARYVHNLTDDDFANCFSFNLRSHLLMSQALAPQMLERGGGSIINVGSSIGQAYLSPLRGNALYASAKAGLIQLTRYLAMEWAPSVRVNCIAPGLVVTDASEQRVDGTRQALLLDRMASGRLGRPEDIAGAALLLASDAGSWITGTTIDVNGGMGLTPVF
jgi:NAD(P)-dependent dehydrogenase (short-subunit alcohol dehydrogenase family)